MADFYPVLQCFAPSGSIIILRNKDCIVVCVESLNALNAQCNVN